MSKENGEMIIEAFFAEMGCRNHPAIPDSLFGETGNLDTKAFGAFINRPLVYRILARSNPLRELDEIPMVTRNFINTVGNMEGCTWVLAKFNVYVSQKSPAVKEIRQVIESKRKDIPEALYLALMTSLHGY